MTRTTLARRLTHLQLRRPLGCPACRSLPPLVILREDEPDPPGACAQCGQPYSGVRVIRIVRVERGPR